MKRFSERGPSPRIRWLAKSIAFIFYRVDVVGAPPVRGPLILLPNHPNALLDPALIIATAGRPVRFLAKSTLFKGAFAPLVIAAGAIPVYRQQDAADMTRNEESFAAVNAALARGEAICIFPEGISHSSGKLEPLRTGAARMALTAAAAGVKVQLVPVGIDLEKKTAFRSRVTVAYGAPIETPMRDSQPFERADVQRLTAHIAEHMRSLLVEAEPRQDAALVNRLERLLQAERPASGPDEALARRRAIAEGLQRLRAERPELYQAALVQLRRYDDRLQRFGMADAALNWDVSRFAARRFAIRELPLALVLVPVALISIIAFAVPYFLTAGAAKLSKDMDATASTKVFGGIAIYGTWIALISWTIGALWGTAAGAFAFVLLPCLAIAGLFAIERETSARQTARAWLAVRSAHPTTKQALKRQRAELAGILEEARQWMQLR